MQASFEFSESGCCCTFDFPKHATWRRTAFGDIASIAVLWGHRIRAC